MDQIEEIDKRVTILENSDRLKLDKLLAIENLLKKIEICLIGGVGENQIGLVSQVRDDRKLVEELRAKMTIVDALIEENRRVKWALRGIWGLFTVLIGYWLKYGK